MKKVLYIITCINLLFQIIYMTLGRILEMGNLKYVFYVFRPEYMVVSGLVAFIIICCFAVLTIKSVKNFRITDLIAIALNIEYLFYYAYFMSIQ